MKPLHFATPVNRIGFLVFCTSLLICLAAYLSTYSKSYYGVDFADLEYMLLDRVRRWQQTAFRFGVFGIVVGATLAWAYQSTVERLINWVRSGSWSTGK